MQDEEREKPDIIDFAVIGAGVAGTYVAWRLVHAPEQILRDLVLTQSGQITVHLFEGTKRIGGRLLTLRMPGTLSLLAELGGMRYTRDQLFLAHLIRELELTD